MTFRRRLDRDDRGVATIEMAFAFPVLIIMIWMVVELGMIYRGLAGIQQALGEGARFATLCNSPTASGCTAPTADAIKTKITASVYGVKPGKFTVADPAPGTSGSSNYFDLKVTYVQPTSLLILPGPTVSVSRSKRVWIATS